MKGERRPKKLILLAGSPNVGKSTIFNALTGMRQHTGNWSGKTVGVAYGRMKGRPEWKVADLPGAYSLRGTSADERCSAACLNTGEGDCVVIVCDGCCLQRNLIFALEILRIQKNAILCVNLMDEAKRQGLRIDGEKLEAALGIPVVLASGVTGRGLEALKSRIDRSIASPCGCTIQITDPLKQAKEIAMQCVDDTKKEDQNWRLQLDRLLVSRRHGGMIGLLLLLTILWLTIWGANYPGQWLDALFRMGDKWLRSVMTAVHPWVRGVLMDGIYSTAAQVISVMLPPVAIFFLLFTFLEDVGYLPRLAFLMERSLHRCGGCGKQALTMCMGLGCNAVGVTGCRIISSESQRWKAMVTNSLMPCNGRFPTLIFLGIFLFGANGGAAAVALCVLASMAVTFIMTGLLRKLPSYGDGMEPFVMEIPPLRRPRITKLLRKALLDRTAEVSARALTVAAPAGAMLWLLSYYGCLPRMAAFLDPVGQWMGMRGWILTGFVLSLPANELLLPVLLMTLQTGADAGFALVASELTPAMAICMMAFTLFHWPCATTLLTVYKETGSIKKTAAAFALPTAVGIVICVVLNLLLR